MTLFLSLSHVIWRREGGALLQLTGWWSLKDDGVIILGSSNYIHRHTCHVNANTLTGTEIRSQAMLCLLDVRRKCAISGPKSLS